MNRITRAKQLRKIIVEQMQNLEDAEALKVPELYDIWTVGKLYKPGEKIRYNKILYKVLQEHTSQADWLPSNTPALYAVVLIPDPEDIPEWVQPDSTNPYNKGDKVKHNNKKWISLIDNNVWEPGVHGAHNLWSEL